MKNKSDFTIKRIKNEFLISSVTNDARAFMGFVYGKSDLVTLSKTGIVYFREMCWKRGLKFSF